jgi:hypothetical protein
MKWLEDQLRRRGYVFEVWYGGRGTWYCLAAVNADHIVQHHGEGKTLKAAVKAAVKHLEASDDEPE